MQSTVGAQACRFDRLTALSNVEGLRPCFRSFEPGAARLRPYSTRSVASREQRQPVELRAEHGFGGTAEPVFDRGRIDLAEIRAEREVLVRLELQRRRGAMQSAFHPRTHHEER